MNKQSKILRRTVVLVSPLLTETKIEALSYIYHVYGRILSETLEYMWEYRVASWTKTKKTLYKVFREKYRDIPSHYIHEAIRDTSQRLKSFERLKKKGLAHTDKPVVEKWSVGCDNQLWKLTLEGVRIATHKGWVYIPLVFHKQFWRYYNGGWTPRSSARWKIIDGRLYLYVVFEKNVVFANKKPPRIYGIDINENNVTIYEYPSGRAITIVTNFSKIVLGYAYRRSAIQEKWSSVLGVKSNRRLKTALKKLRERNVKKDIKYKLAKKVVGIVGDGLVVLEKLPRRFQEKAVRRNGRLRGLNAHRLIQSSIRGVQALIVEKLVEKGVPFVFVDPSYTSSTCPICGSKLAPVTGIAQRARWKPRLVKCPRCNFTHDRDVVGAINLVKKYTLDVGGRAVGLPKGVHDLHVEWSVATMKRGVKTQPVLAKPTTT